MKPGVIEWATNANFALGPDVGSPTKAPPTAAQIDDGYYTDLKVAPQIWNYERWAMMLKAQHASSMRLLNWIATSGMVTPAGAVRGDGVYDPTTWTHVWTTCNAAGASTERNAVGGLVYAGGVACALAAGAVPRIATDGAGAFVQTSALAAPLPNYCAGVGAGWAVPGPWVVAGTWAVCAHDHAGGLWVFGDTVGNAICHATGPAAGMIAATTPPGFAVGVLGDMTHSHHPAATVYPGDAGNQQYAAIAIAGAGLSEWSTSADGDVWTAATQPFTGIPRRIGYSAYGQRWIVAENANVYERSDDNGVSWGMYPLPTSLLAGVVTQSAIASDGFGDWVIVQTDGATVQVMVSWDNGENFYHAFMVTAPAVVNIGVWYGNGRFHLVVDDAAGVSASFATLAGGDD